MSVYRKTRRRGGASWECRPDGPKCSDCGADESIFWKLKPATVNLTPVVANTADQSMNKNVPSILETDSISTATSRSTSEEPSLLLAFASSANSDGIDADDDDADVHRDVKELTEATSNNLCDRIICADCSGRKRLKLGSNGDLKHEGFSGASSLLVNNEHGDAEPGHPNKEEEERSEASERLSTAGSNVAEKEQPREPRRMSSRQREQTLKKEAEANSGGRSSSLSDTSKASLPPVSLPKTRTGASGRRNQFFKPPGFTPFKAPKRRATVVTADSLWHNGERFAVGDVVSVQDVDDERCYFAQIRGLLSDPYCERFGTLTWLLPTTGYDHSGKFDPLRFIPGPVDESMYPLDAMDFVQSWRPLS